MRRPYPRSKYVPVSEWPTAFPTAWDYLKYRWPAYVIGWAGALWLIVWGWLMGGYGFWWVYALMTFLGVANLVVGPLGALRTYRKVIAPHIAFIAALDTMDRLRETLRAIAEDEPGPDAMTTIYTESERTDNDGRALP